MTAYNLHLIKTKRSYGIKEIADLLKVDRKTCSRWLKEGLRVLERDVKPVLIMGSDLKDFLAKKRLIRKKTLKDDEFYCFKCHKAVTPKEDSLQVISTGKTIGRNRMEQMKKVGECEVCGTKLHKFLKVYQKD